MEKKRKIIHIDMDAFYASIEMRDNPKWRDKPLVIARDPRHSGGKGVVATANYIARSYGVHSAMAAAEALEKCPDAVFKTPDFPKYRKISAEIHTIFHEYTDIIEPIAFDEAYLDVTVNKKNIVDPVVLAHKLQWELFEKTHLTSSAGVSYNKFLAKLASDYHKPIGLTVVHQADVSDFLLPLPIEKFRGVGKKTVLKMHALNIYTGADLIKKSEAELIANFGKIGYFFYQCVRGIDERPVEWQRERKSIGNERTYDQVLTTIEEVDDFLNWAAKKLAGTLQEKKLHGKTLVIKVRNSDFETITKRLTQNDFFKNDTEILVYYGKQLFEQIQSTNINVRLLGLTMTGLAPMADEDKQLSLWG